MDPTQTAGLPVLNINLTSVLTSGMLVLRADAIGWLTEAKSRVDRKQPVTVELTGQEAFQIFASTRRNVDAVASLGIQAVEKMLPFDLGPAATAVPALAAAGALTGAMGAMAWFAAYAHGQADVTVGFNPGSDLFSAKDDVFSVTVLPK